MPRAPQYAFGQQRSAQTTQARFREADDGGGIAGGIGQGLQDLSGAVSQAASIQDQIAARNDDTQARKLGAEARIEYAKLTTEYSDLRAGMARGKQEEYSKRIDELRDSFLDQTENDRMRRILEQDVEAMRATAISRVSTHAIREARVEREASFVAEEEALTQDAVGAESPAVRDALIAQARDKRWERLRDQGMSAEDNADVFKTNALDVSTKIHAGVIDRMFSSVDPDLEAIAGYVGAYDDEMSEDLENQVMSRLQRPLQARVARSDADEVMSLGKPSDAPVATGKPVSNGKAADLDAITEDAESRGRRYGKNGGLLRSPVGAMGEMQVMPTTARAPGFGIKPWDGKDPDDLARVGKQYRKAMEKRYGGDLAKMWAAYNWGPGAVDNAVKKHGDNWLAHAPKETRDYVRRNMGKVGAQTQQGYASQAREWDREAVYDGINKKVASGDWSSERGERARQEVDRRIQRDEGLLREKERDADEAAAEIMLQGGEGFRSTNQIPRKVWDQMSVSARARAESVADRNSAPETAQSNSPAFLELRLARANGTLGEVNLSDYIGKVTPSELGTMAEAQAKSRNKTEKAFSPRTKINAHINHGKRIDMIEIDDEDYAAIYEIMDAEARALQASRKGELTDDDYRRLFRNATREVSTSQTILGIEYGKGTKRRFEIDAGTIADSDRKRITTALRNIYGDNYEPSDEEITQYWRRHMSR